MVRVWKANCTCQMPFRDFLKGETVELDDKDVTPRVKALFTCLTPEQVKSEEDAKKVDPDFKVMVERLKAAKVPLKRGITKAEVKVLFDQFLATGATAGAVSGENADADEKDAGTKGEDKSADSGE